MVVPLSAEPGQCGCHSGRVERGGVEVGGVVEAQPFQSLLVLGMMWVVQDLQERLVPPDAAAVLRWGRATAAGAARIPDVWAAFEDLLQHDLVFPGVAEIVGVADLCLDVGKYLLQRNRLFGTLAEIRVRSAESAVRRLEGVQMAVVPVE